MTLLFSAGSHEEQSWCSSSGALSDDPNELAVIGISLGQARSGSATLTRTIASDARILDDWLTKTMSMSQTPTLDTVPAIAAVSLAGVHASKEPATLEDINCLHDLQRHLRQAARIPPPLDHT